MFIVSVQVTLLDTSLTPSIVLMALERIKIINFVSFVDFNSVLLIPTPLNLHPSSQNESTNVDPLKNSSIDDLRLD